ncbi:hypothetical protein B0H21DRAFT_697092, partial [Amylocystis lapponica]
MLNANPFADTECEKRCTSCRVEEATWRCLHCFGRPTYCTLCCRKQHERNPFHRVEKW